MRPLLLLVLLLAQGSATDLIDRGISERWDSEGVKPAPAADDYEFLRRLSLDLRGVIPTPEEVRAFAGESDPSKREKTADAWLRSDAFAAWWARRWTEDLTLYPTGKVREVHDAFRGWIRDALRSNMPYDRFVKRILTAKGPSDLDPAVGFLAAGLFNAKDEGPKDVVERTARVFLGMQIRCAECHDHPFDDWTQQDFYGMASFFWQARSEVRTGGGMEGQSGWIVDDTSRGEPGVPVPQKGAKKPEEPKEPKGAKISAPRESFGPRYKSTGEGVAANETRRAAFARLLTSDRQFARAAVNRHWGLLLGRGLVHPLDGFTAARKPSHPELLEALADDFVASGYDVRRLIKSIVLSKPYQRSSKHGGPEGAAGRLFSQAAVAPLLPEQLFESLVRATGLDQLKPSPKGKPVSPVDAFRESFFREFKASLQPNEPAAPVADPTISQALYFLNGDLVSRGTASAAEARLGRLLDGEKDPARRIEELFLMTVSRLPKTREAESILARLRKSGDSVRVYEDLYWALLNSTEFVTRH
jgi:hypothetical protein